MPIEDTSLISEVNAIITSTDQRISYAPRAELRAHDEEIPIIKLMAMEIRRSYSTSHSDTVFVDVIIPEGAFTYRLYPNKDNLLMTIYMDPIGVQSFEDLESEEIESQTFRAILHDDGSVYQPTDGMQSFQEHEIDLSTLRQHRLELIDLTAEQMRLMTIGTVIRETPVEEALRYLMAHSSGMVEIENEQAVDGVDIAPINNESEIDQFLVPHGTPVLDLADLFQNSIGLYSTGVGSYLQRKTWYVFPLFDVERFDRVERSLTIINVPPRRYAGLDRTYRQTASQTIALATGRISGVNLSDVAMVNDGNGVRFADPDRMFKIFGIAEENRTTVDRSEIVNEAKTVEMRTEMNYAPFSNNSITMNAFNELSSISGRNGALIAVHWDYSDPEAIYPGIPVKFIYEADGEIRETQGIVLEAIHAYMSAQTGLVKGGYNVQTVLLMFVKRRPDELNLGDDE